MPTICLDLPVTTPGTVPVRVVDVLIARADGSTALASQCGLQVAAHLTGAQPLPDGTVRFHWTVDFDQFGVRDVLDLLVVPDDEPGAAPVPASALTARATAA